MLEKTFDPASSEADIYRAWEESGAFKPSSDPSAAPFTIFIPPPNVTGSLHMGHALNNTLQDILCRFERMRGKSVLWQPGMDHAGIATQMVVERQLAAEGNEDRRSMGRPAFIDRVWSWKAESGGAILNQLKRLGASCDWSRERFTMDEGLSAAVLEVFVALYNEGLIYRDKRLVNWDPKFETAISDLEVENKEVNGHFWHFKYPLEGGETYEYIEKDADGEITLREERDYISIATTRPETMLGDGAVAVHPSDERYAPIVGKRCILPLAERAIPIITDEYPDPDFGSGAVKITGAHDFNDYQVARRNDIQMYVLMDTKGAMADADFVPEKYRGLDRFEARKAIVADIDARGLMIRVEDKKIMQPFGDRSGVVIEPMLTDQWYVNAEALAKDAIKAVETGETKFIPETWTKTYYQWMRNIEPWCVSRQLWWGHRIPAWYGPDNEIFVAKSEADARSAAQAKYGVNEIYFADSPPRDGDVRIKHDADGNVEAVALWRDEDVLDTWFSSALWPF
ncbi:MAG: valine--tRNA ligase, partial [Pseudomonadota bacterium]